MTTPCRHWFRFSLRAMLIVVTACCCWLGYQVNWIRQRCELRQESGLGKVLFYGVKVGGTPAPWQLRIFGERGYTGILVFDENQFDEYTSRSKRLFPEAEVSDSRP